MISFRIWKKLSGQWQKKNKNEKIRIKEKNKKAAARIGWNRCVPPLSPQAAAEVSRRLLRGSNPLQSAKDWTDKEEARRRLFKKWGKGSVRLGNPGNAHKYPGNFIPGGIIHSPCLGKAENPLENLHRICCLLSVNPVCGYIRDSGIILADPVKLFLHLQYLSARGAYSQGIAGPGGGDTADGIGSVDIHIAAIIIMYDLHSAVAFISQIFGPPLA